jgi:hypothetical protein
VHFDELLIGTGASGISPPLPVLNHFLQRFALVNQNANSSQTYVSCSSGSVVGFYSLTGDSVEPATAALRAAKAPPSSKYSRAIASRFSFLPTHLPPRAHGFFVLEDARPVVL